jgi:alpha-N-arabinofuranosidase
MYRDHFGTLPVTVSGNSPQPAPRYPPYGDQPKSAAGSPTYPLDIVAALTEDHKFLTIAVVNATDSEQKFDLNVTGCRLDARSTRWQMTGKDVDAANHVGEEPQVRVKQMEIGSVGRTLAAAPISVSIYQFSLL